MNEIVFITLLNIMFFLPVSATGADKEKTADAPNIIIILADDLGWGDLGCYGNPIIKTPNLDELAASGMRFTQFHSGGAICSPSRAALLTGKSPYRLGIYHIIGGDMQMKSEEIMIPELLKQKHYSTFFTGKWHVSEFERGLAPDSQGFDHYFASLTNSKSGEIPTTRNPTNLVRNGQAVNNADGYYCDLIIDEAVNWIKSTRDYKQPFFMEICFSEPHTPVTPPMEYAERYEGPEVDSLARTLGYGGILRFNGRYKGFASESNFNQKRYYYGLVEQMDAAVGNFIQFLKESGTDENTIIIFTSDNGPEYPGMGFGLDPYRNRSWGSPGPYRGVKRRVYEGGHTVPGIISWPGKIDPGQVCEIPISGVDMLSTICKLAGADFPHHTALDGTDISVLFKDPEVKINRTIPLYWNTTYWGIPNMSMKYDDYTILAYFTIPADPEYGNAAWANEARLHHFEVYNVQSDIKQQYDLYPGNEDRYQFLVDEMIALWDRVQKDSPECPGCSPGKIKTIRKTGFDVENFDY